MKKFFSHTTAALVAAFASPLFTAQAQTQQDLEIKEISGVSGKLLHSQQINLPANHGVKFICIATTGGTGDIDIYFQYKGGVTQSIPNTPPVMGTDYSHSSIGQGSGTEKYIVIYPGTGAYNGYFAIYGKTAYNNVQRILTIPQDNYICTVFFDPNGGVGGPAYTITNQSLA